MFSGVIATLFTVSTDLILSSNTFMLLVVSTPVLAFVVLTPIINHVRMFFAVRQHRNQVVDAVSSNNQQALILRREKKVAYDMMILIAVLVLSQAPSFILKATHSSFPEEYRYLFPWGLLFVLLKASVDPIIYFWRNKELRNAIKSFVSY